MTKKQELVTILGTTAVGKTAFAALLAKEIGGEIISADSRQVFKQMDIGTGKDLADYVVEGKQITAHLIDVAEPGSEFSVFRFKQLFFQAYRDICNRGNTPILCGGSGLYLEAVLLGYNLSETPHDNKLRLYLEKFSKKELIDKLQQYKKLHNTTDTTETERLIRAIEIEEYKLHQKEEETASFKDSLVLGLRFNRETLREKITKRLQLRLQQGMIEEVQNLMDTGIAPEKLKFYGLEYKYLTMYLTGELSKEKMTTLLNTAIHQFAKRQMTWFRRMERNGIKINWLEGENGVEHNVNATLKMIYKK